MTKKSVRIVWAWCLVALAIIIAYYGYMIPAVLGGTLAVIVAGADGVKFFEDEEEETEEEEL